MAYDPATSGPRRTARATRGTTSDRLRAEGRPDPAELARWTAANQRAADEYTRHPIIATAVCEVCGHTSATALCPTCKETTP